MRGKRKKTTIKVVRKKRKPRENIDRPYNMGTLTKSGFFGKLRAGLRHTFRYYKSGQEALKNASRPSKSLNKRLKTEYQCSVCKKWFKRTDVEIHHKIEVGSLRDWDDVVPFIKRLTEEDPKNYAIICKKDHSIITQKSKEEKDDKSDI